MVDAFVKSLGIAGLEHVSYPPLSPEELVLDKFGKAMDALLEAAKSTMLAKLAMSSEKTTEDKQRVDEAVKLAVQTAQAALDMLRHADNVRNAVAQA